MSLAIDVDIIEKVLLSDGWHEVADGSFQVDAYEYIHGGRAVLSAGQVQGVDVQWRAMERTKRHHAGMSNHSDPCRDVEYTG